MIWLYIFLRFYHKLEKTTALRETLKIGIIMICARVWTRVWGKLAYKISKNAFGPIIITLLFAVLLVLLVENIKNIRRINMKTIDKLLKIDAGKIKRKEGMVTLKLARLDGMELDFPLVEVDPEYVTELQEESLVVNLNNDDIKIKTFDQKVFTIIEGCPLIFKNDEIIKHFNCQTPKDLVKKILTAGDMDDLFEEIQKLNGYNKKEDKEKVKN